MHSVGNDMQAVSGKVWAVSEVKTGTLTQCLGVGAYFDPQPTQKIVKPVHGIKRLFAPSLFSRSETPPEIIISCGYRPEKPVMAMRRAFKGYPLTVHLQRPEIEGYDLCFVSRHDWTSELDGKPNFHKMIGVPHRVTAERLAPLKQAARARFAPNGERVLAIFLGGPNGAYVYDEAVHRRIAEIVADIVSQGWRVVISTSRRSQPPTLEAVLSLRGPQVDVWDRTGENPYFDYLAAADAFLIAKDSITMPCEALVTGNPVYTLDLTQVAGERLEKFERFHRDLQTVLSLTRSFNGALDPYPYETISETPRLAGIIADRVVARRNASQPAHRKV